jgi:hypothetical protein
MLSLITKSLYGKEKFHLKPQKSMFRYNDIIPVHKTINKYIVYPPVSFLSTVQKKIEIFHPVYSFSSN